MDKYFDKGENKYIGPVEGITVRCLHSGIVLSGSLVITNFRLLYVSDSSLPIKESSSTSTEKLTEQAPQRSSLFPLRVVHISIPLHSIASVEVQELDLPLLLSELPSEQQERILTDTTFRTTGAPFPQSTLSSGSRQITPPLFDGTGSAANSARKFQIPPGDRRVISSSLSTSTYPNSGAVGAADLVIVSPELIGGQTRRLPVVIVQTKQMGREVFIWPVAQEANSRSSRVTQEFASELRHYSGLSIDPNKIKLLEKFLFELRVQMHDIDQSHWPSSHPAPIPFAFSFGRNLEPSCPVPSTPDIVQKDLIRLGVKNQDSDNKGSLWRISTANLKYELCSTYPSALAVPNSVDDALLRSVAQFRSRGRVPVLSWLDTNSGASITRCAQPLIGLLNDRNADDVRLVNAIAETNPRGKKFYILDARPQANAEANRIKGGGYERAYSVNVNVTGPGGQQQQQAVSSEQVEVRFLNIANIHAVRESFARLHELAQLYCLAEQSPALGESALRLIQDTTETSRGGEPAQALLLRSLVDSRLRALQAHYYAQKPRAEQNPAAAAAAGATMSTAPGGVSAKSSNLGASFGAGGGAKGKKAVRTSSGAKGRASSVDAAAWFAAPKPPAKHKGRHDNLLAWWLRRLRATKWLAHTEQILSAAKLVVQLVAQENCSVLVHCSDGWDRTAQITSLAMLLLDPFYRTIRGFEVLIEREWIAMGHKFADRTGLRLPLLSSSASADASANASASANANANAKSKTPLSSKAPLQANTDGTSGAAAGTLPHAHSGNEEFAPVFVQFLECVVMLVRRFPNSFEFNEQLLLFILDEHYSARFGDFLCNSEQERCELHQMRARTHSIWNAILKHPLLYVNPLYGEFHPNRLPYAYILNSSSGAQPQSALPGGALTEELVFTHASPVLLPNVGRYMDWPWLAAHFRHSPCCAELASNQRELAARNYRIVRVLYELEQRRVKTRLGAHEPSAVDRRSPSPPSA